MQIAVDGTALTIALRPLQKRGCLLKGRPIDDGFMLALVKHIIIGNKPCVKRVFEDPQHSILAPPAS